MRKENKMISNTCKKRLENWKEDTVARIARYKERGKDAAIWETKLAGIIDFLANIEKYSDQDVTDWIHNHYGVES